MTLGYIEEKVKIANACPRCRAESHKYKEPLVSVREHTLTTRKLQLMWCPVCQKPWWYDIYIVNCYDRIANFMPKSIRKTLGPNSKNNNRCPHCGGETRYRAKEFRYNLKVPDALYLVQKRKCKNCGKFSTYPFKAFTVVENTTKDEG